MGVIGDGKIGRNKIDAKFLDGPTVLYFRGWGRGSVLKAFLVLKRAKKYEWQ